MKNTIRKQFADRVLQETGYEIYGKIYYRTLNQYSYSGVKAFYHANAPYDKDKNMNRLVMLSNSIKDLLKAEKWNIVEDWEGIEISI